MTAPTSESSRIESLDVFRGFALLGILLLNIIGFALYSPSYSNPAFDLVNGSALDVAAWATIELTSEGAMRCLFSILFGAGVVLFTTGENGKSGWVHYKRTFWLLMFGLFNAYVLLWNGDILVAYAISGAILYLVRNKSAKTLIILASVLIALMSLLHMGMNFGLTQAKLSDERVAAAIAEGKEPGEADKQAGAGWQDMQSDYNPSPAKLEQERKERTQNYLSAFEWNAKKNMDMYTLVLPLFLLWDALAMMMLGMAFYKTGVLQAARSRAFYIKLMVFGFGAGLLVNGYEVSLAYRSGFDFFATFAQMQPTYHFGRLGMALGYIGLLGVICQSGVFSAITERLAAVGRMALTNYLMHSLICAIIFTGMGFGLLGQFSRFEIYGFVIGIWLFQLWLSPLWLRYYKFGPTEWLWRTLTYGTLPGFRRLN